ncbi:MAG: HAD family hydrolase [Brevundimonas sp.]
MTLTGLAQSLRSRRLLIFDLDGTLADTGTAHARAFAEILDPLGLAFRYADIAGMTTEAALARIVAANRTQLDAVVMDDLARRKRLIAREILSRDLSPFPGLVAFLDAVSWARLAVCSSGSRGTVNQSLRTMALADRFDPVVCGEDVTRGKPEPEPFLRVLDLAGVTAADALIFEDSPSGLASARAAGIDAIRIDPDAQGVALDADALAVCAWPALVRSLKETVA